MKLHLGSIRIEFWLMSEVLFLEHFHKLDVKKRGASNKGTYPERSIFGVSFAFLPKPSPFFLQHHNQYS